MPIGQGERWAYDAVEHRDNAERMASDAGQQTDVIPPGTGPAGPAGQNALTATLTLDRVSLTCDKDGNLLGPGPIFASTKMSIMNGAVDDTALWTFSAAPPSSSGGVSYVLYADGSLDITGMYAGLYDQEITIRAQRASWPDLYKRFSISKSLAGPPGSPGTNGADAQTLGLKATAQAFTFDKEGVAAPASQSITFTALRQNLPADALTWTCARFSATGAVLSDGVLTGSGDSRSLSLASFGTAALARVSIVANPSGLADQITVVRLKDGENAIVGYLTNEAMTVAASQDGVVDPALWPACGGTFKVFYGIADVTGAGPVYSVVSRLNFDPTQFTIDPVTGVYSVTGIAGSANTATARVRAAYRGVNIDKDYVLVRSRAGQNGTPGSSGSPGSRGSMRFYVPTTGAEAWNAALAWTTCAAYPPYAGGPAQPTPRDTVTIYNANATPSWALTRYYNGGAYPGTWQTMAEVLDGNLLVHGTVSAEGFDADALRTSNYLAGTVVIGGVTYEYAVQGAKMRRTTGLVATAPSLLVDPRGFMLGKRLFNQTWLGNVRFVGLNNVWVDGAGGATCEAPTYYLDIATEINDWVSNTSQGTVGIRFNNAYAAGFRHMALVSQSQRGQTRYFLRPAVTSPVTTNGSYLQLNLQLFSFTALDDGFGNITYNPASSWNAAGYPHFDIIVMLLAADGSGIWGA